MSQFLDYPMPNWRARLGLALIMPLIIMLAWNYGPAEAFALPSLTYWQALLCKVCYNALNVTGGDLLDEPTRP